EDADQGCENAAPLLAEDRFEAFACDAAMEDVRALPGRPFHPAWRSHWRMTIAAVACERCSVLDHRPDLDCPACPCGRNLCGDLDRLVQVVGFDQVEAAQVLLRLGEGAVGRHRLAVVDLDGGRLGEIAEVGAALRLRVTADRHVLLGHGLLLFLAELLPASFCSVDQEGGGHFASFCRCRDYDERATPISTFARAARARRLCRAARFCCCAYGRGTPAARLRGSVRPGT